MSRAKGQLTKYKDAMNSLKNSLTETLEKRAAKKNVQKLRGLIRRIEEMIAVEEKKIKRG